MKNSTLKNLSIFTFGICLFALMGACKKEETDTTIAYLRVVNASPSSPTYNVYVNDSKINSAALPYIGSTSYASYSAATYSVKFTSASSAVSLLTKSLALNPSTYNSYYLVNKAGALDTFTTGDDLSVPSADKAYVRFINLSPDAPALDLAKASTTTSWFTNKTYKSATGFMAIDGGSYTLNAKETSTGTIKATSTSITFTAGYHYDVICGGLVTPANDTERSLNIQAILLK